MVHITSLVMEKMQFNHFLIISLWEFSVAMATKQWSLVIKYINWVDNHPMIITAKYGSHHFTDYGENAI